MSSHRFIGDGDRSFSDDRSSGAAFCGELGHANILMSLLQAIVVRDKPQCIMSADVTGFRATCENSRSMQGSAILPKQLFRSYDLRQADVSVKVDLMQLLSCLGSSSTKDSPDAAFASAVAFQTQSHLSEGENMSLRITIWDELSPLELQVTEGDMTTTLELGSLTGGFHLFPTIPEHSVTSRLSLPSCAFVEMFLEFDPNAPDVGMRVDQNKFRFWFRSEDGKSELAIKQDEESDVHYEYFGRDLSHNYRFRHSLINETIASLVISKRTKIATANLTSVTYSILIDPDGETADIQYIIVAKHDVGDEVDLYSEPEDDPDDIAAGTEFSTFSLGQNVNKMSISTERQSLSRPVARSRDVENNNEVEAAGAGGGTFPVAPAVPVVVPLEQEHRDDGDEEWDDNDETFSEVV